MQLTGTEFRPSGGRLSWRTTSNLVTLSNITGNPVTVTSVGASVSRGDVKVSATYCVTSSTGDKCSTLYKDITIVRPTSIVQSTPSTYSPNGHLCDPAYGGISNCSTSNFQGNSAYTSYRRDRVYRIHDQFSPSIAITGYPLQIQESFSGLSGCTGGKVNVGTGSGDTIPDCFYMCSEACRLGQSCQTTGTQNISVNGFPVANKSVTWNCSDATITP